MTQKQTTSTTGQYNQGSMGVYNTAQQQFGNAITGEINDPYSNMFFNQQLGMGQQQLGAQGASAQRALTQRSQALGINPNSPFMASQMGMLQRQGMAGQSGLFNNLLMQAGQMRQSAIGMAGQYRPLQTGQTQTQTIGGTGSWLPQVVGAGVGAASAFLTGGASGMSGFGGASSGPMAGSSGPGMQDVSGGAFGEGQFNPYGNPNTGMSSPFMQ